MTKVKRIMKYMCNFCGILSGANVLSAKVVQRLVAAGLQQDRV